MLNWTDDTTFEIDGVRITLDYAHGGSARTSTPGDFTMMKGKDFLAHYTDLATGGFDKVLELGLYQGGSFVFLDKILKPSKISAVELSTVALPALDAYVDASQGRCRLHYGVSQDDAASLEQIVDRDFGGELDLVADDASHFYEPTKTSFQTLFPKLRPGGLYIIEDWAWNFRDPFQAPDAPWHEQNALANLVVDLMEDMVTGPLIGSIEIHRPLIKVWRSTTKQVTAPFSKSARRGRPSPLI